MISLNPTFSAGLPDEPADAPAARYGPGDLVRHRRYGYRGVVVAVDPECRADDGWYLANQTQPERNQPWYHVLVHGTVSSTYAAEVNLAPDPAGQPIDHPLVEEFFVSFASGRYRRNRRPWGKKS